MRSPFNTQSRTQSNNRGSDLPPRLQSTRSGPPPPTLSGRTSEGPRSHSDCSGDGALDCAFAGPHTPAVLAFLADRQEGLPHERKIALARAVALARGTC